MKKTAVILSVIMIFAAIFSLPACADSATIALSKSSVTVGSNVTVTLTYNAGYEMYGIDFTLENKNTSVLQYVSGGTNSGSTVKIVETLSGEKRATAKVTFKAIAAGSCSLSFSGKASGNGDGSASAGATVTVTEAQPSANANLGSLKISEGTLSPEFKANTTNYTASVKYNIESVTISANAAAGDSKVAGAGTFKLNVGENKQVVTVTAASGGKKEYTVTVKRMTEEETVAFEQQERANNPYLIVVNELDYFIKPDLSELGSIAGYTLSSVERKGASIQVFNDDKGKYSLYWATDENGQNGSFFAMDGQDEFRKLNYFKFGDKLYIIERFDSGISANSAFIPAKYELGGESVDCYKYASGKYNDFCVFYCYANGENEYYRYDGAENTIQREPGFIVESEDVAVKSSAGLFNKIAKMNNQAKMILILLVLASVLVVVLIILMIIKAVGKTPEEEEAEESPVLPPQEEPFDYIGTSDDYPGEPEDNAGDTEEPEETEDESEFLDPEDD